MKQSTFTKQKALVWVASGAAVLGFAVGATGFASAATNSTDTTAPQIQLDANAPQANGQQSGPAAGETALTGDEATKVTEAALSAAPGATVDRVETDDVHAYEAHVTLEDGTQKILFFNESFEADGEEVPPVGGPAHHGQTPDQNATAAPSATTN